MQFYELDLAIHGVVSVAIITIAVVTTAIATVAMETCSFYDSFSRSSYNYSLKY